MEPLGFALRVAAFLFSIFLVFKVRQYKAQRLANPRGLPYPPGPRCLPIIGNLLDLARENESAMYYRLAQKYGDLVFLRVFGQSVLFVNSFKTANDLFEKRSANYSDRKRSVMIHELMGWDWSFGHMPYGEDFLDPNLSSSLTSFPGTGEKWKLHRKMFHRQFQQSVAPIHWPVQHRETRALLRRLLHSPQELRSHLRHNAASVIMGVTYGVSIQDRNDRYVTSAEKALSGMSKAANPGAFLVDFLPILKNIPEWCPGSGFLHKARDWRKAVIEMRDAPFEFVQTTLAEGTAPPSFVSNLISDLELKEDTETQLNTIRDCAGLAYAAGAESTVSTLTTFVLAMATHPEVQTKAQKELDSLIGRSRLPEFSDRTCLPYIDAIMKEVLRWNPVAPLGLPHMVTKDDEYNGYFIPAGTVVVGNTWTILHDPKAFPDPHRFNPDRFLNNGDGQQFSPMHPLSASFGYGRRICPGRYMAEAQLWISMACILSVFDIGPGIDEMGRPKKIVPAFSSGMICHPMPFDFTIKPRGDYVRSLID